MNAKETDPRARNISAVDCAAVRRIWFDDATDLPTAREGRTKSLSRLERTHGGPAPAKSGHMADNGGQRADTWRTHGGHTLIAWWTANTSQDTWRTRPIGQSGLKAETRQTQGGHMVDTCRKRFGGAGEVDSTQRPAVVFLRENLFGELHQHRPQTAFKHKHEIASALGL